MGYRYSIDNNEVRFVGLIDVETLPKSVRVYLNDTLITRSTPKQIKDLFPRIYTVRVEKDGHNTWQKNVFVESKKVTWIKNVRLFLSNPTIETLVPVKSESYTVFDDGKKILYTKNNEDSKGLFLYDVKDKKITHIFPGEKEFLSDKILIDEVTYTNTLYSNDGKLSLLTLSESSGNEHYVLVPTDKPESSKLITNDALSPTSTSHITLDPKNTNHIYFISENTLFLYDLEKEEITKINENSATFTIHEGTLYVAEKSKEGKTTITRTQDSMFTFGESVETLTTLSAETVSSIVANGNGDMAVLDSKKNVYLYNAETKETKHIGSHINNLLFSKSGKKLLFYNDQEVYFYEISEKELEQLKQPYSTNTTNLITRYSKQITGAGFYADEEWVYVAFNDSLKLIELDERDKRNTYQALTDFPLDPSIFFDKEGETLFMLNKDTKQIQSEVIFEK